MACGDLGAGTEHLASRGADERAKHAGLEQHPLGAAAILVDIPPEEGGKAEDAGDGDLLLDERHRVVVEPPRGDAAALRVDLVHPGVRVVGGALELRRDDGQPVVGLDPVAVGGGGLPVVGLVADGPAEAGDAPPGEQGEEDDGEEARAEHDELAPALPALGVGGVGDQPLLAEDLVHEQVAKEVRPVPLPHLALGQALDGHAERLGEVGVQGGALSHRAGEVDAPQEERLGRPLAGDEDHLQVPPQARRDGRQRLREGVQGVHLVGATGGGVLRVDGVQQQPEPAAHQALHHRLEVLIDQLRVERLVQLRRVRPAQHLVLELRVGDVLEELAEAVDQVALRDHHEHGEPHAQRPLNLVELLGDPRALPLQLVGRVLDQRVRRDAQQHAVDRAVRAVRAEQLQKLPPLAGRAGLDLLEHQPPGGVQDDGVVREPPVHVDGAAGALELVLEAGREADVAVADGLGLARPGLADEHVPRQGIEVLPGGAEPLDAPIEVLAQVVEARPASGLGDALRRGGAVVAEGLLHRLGLALPGAPDQPAEQAGEHPHQRHADDDVEEPPGRQEAYHGVHGADHGPAPDGGRAHLRSGWHRGESHRATPCPRRGWRGGAAWATAARRPPPREGSSPRG